MIKDFISKIFPFGKREALVVDEKVQERIYSLVAEQPELWEALKEVAYAIMNQKARVAIVAQKNDNYIAEILAIDDFLKMCMTIKEKKRDIEVETNGHLPTMADTAKAQAPAKKEKGIAHYLVSKDIKNKKGEARVTIRR